MGAVTRSRQARILIALSREEEAIFFPDFQWNQFPAQEWRRFDPQGQDEAEWRNALRTFNPTALVSCWSTPPLPMEIVEAPSRPLQYVCHVTGSVRQVVPRRFIERGGWVTNWGDLASVQVAEHALLLLLALLRNLPHWRNYVCVGQPRHSVEFLRTQTLVGRRVGLHGYGRIARQLIALLRPFQVEIGCYSGGVPRSVIESGGVVPSDSLEELFAQSDVIVECEALTPRSLGSITGKLLDSLPPGAVFVNVGRGRVVDERALIARARSGRLRVGVDVAAVEPIHRDSPLFKCEEILFSPHIGGPTFDRFPACGDYALRNLERYVAGHPLESLLNVDVYDRST